MEIPQILIGPSLFLPIIGLGTWGLKGEKCTTTVKKALELGYRHFDTAILYENHRDIQKAMKGFDRGKIFLTSKFKLAQTEQMSVESICDHILIELETDYLDLFLLHYPDRSYDIAAILRQAQQLIDKQKIRAIGVSNCTQRHVQDLMDQQIEVSVNQVEFHPYLNQKNLLAFCRRHQIHLMSYRSLGKGVLTHDPLLEKIGKKYGKTAAQINLRWLIGQGISVIPKAQSEEHLKENMALFDFALDAEDLAILSDLGEQRRFCNNEWSDFNYR